METWKNVIQGIVSVVTVFSFLESVMYGVGAVMSKNDAKLWRCENIRKQTLEEAKSEKRKAIKSLKGLIRVDTDAYDRYYAIDCVSKAQEEGGCLETVFENGKLVKEVSMAQIRERLCR